MILKVEGYHDLIIDAWDFEKEKDIEFGYFRDKQMKTYYILSYYVIDAVIYEITRKREETNRNIDILCKFWILEKIKLRKQI